MRGRCSKVVLSYNEQRGISRDLSSFEGGLFGALVALLNEGVVDLDDVSSLFIEFRTVRVV
jgi:hypothetical protein